MASQRKQFPFHDFEPKWQSQWLATRAFSAPNPGDPDFESREAEVLRPRHVSLSERRGTACRPHRGIHGHRYHRSLQADARASTSCTRWDGMPSACPRSNSPSRPVSIRASQRNAISLDFKQQLQSIGFSYDWAREFSTTDPDYFRWTQWIFLKLYNSWFNPVTRKAEPIATYAGEDADEVRLAYVAEMPVNWCPALGTVPCERRGRRRQE